MAMAEVFPLVLGSTLLWSMAWATALVALVSLEMFQAVLLVVQGLVPGCLSEFAL